MNNWRQIFSWDVPAASIVEVIDKVIQRYQEKGEKVRFIWLIRDVMRETGAESILRGTKYQRFRNKVEETIHKELIARGWETGRYDDM